MFTYTAKYNVTQLMGYWSWCWVKTWWLICVKTSLRIFKTLYIDTNFYWISVQWSFYFEYQIAIWRCRIIPLILNILIKSNFFSSLYIMWIEIRICNFAFHLGENTLLYIMYSALPKTENTISRQFLKILLYQQNRDWGFEHCFY